MPIQVVQQLSDVTYERMAQEGSPFHTHCNHVLPYYPKQPKFSYLTVNIIQFPLFLKILMNRKPLSKLSVHKPLLKSSLQRKSKLHLPPTYQNLFSSTSYLCFKILFIIQSPFLNYFHKFLIPKSSLENLHQTLNHCPLTFELLIRHIIYFLSKPPKDYHNSKPTKGSILITIQFLIALPVRLSLNCLLSTYPLFILFIIYG